MSYMSYMSLIPYSYEGYGMDENIIEEFMLTRRLLDEALVYADTATRLSDVAAVDPELAHMTRAQFVAFVSPVLAHRERVTTAAYGAGDDALLGSFLDTLTLAYIALHPVVTDERGRPIYEIAALYSILYEWAERAGAEMYRMSGLERHPPRESSPRTPEVEQAIADMEIELVAILDQAEAEFRDEVRQVKARVAALEDTDKEGYNRAAALFSGHVF